MTSKGSMPMQVRPLLLLLTLLSAAISAHAQAGTSDAPLVDRKAGRPMVLAFDVEPGYFNQVQVPAEEGDVEDTKALRVTIAPPAGAEWTAGTWNPTVFLCLQPAAMPKQSYCVNLDVDREHAMRTFGSARLRSEAGELMFGKQTSRMFEPHAPVELRVVRKGEHVTTSFNGEVIDDGDIGFTPANWAIGASTGVAKVEVEDVEAPPGPGEWPTTVDAAVAMELERLSSSSRTTLRGEPKEFLQHLWIGWGTMLRDRLGLARGNKALAEAACGQACQPDAAARAIMEAVWGALHQQPKR